MIDARGPYRLPDYSPAVKIPEPGQAFVSVNPRAPGGLYHEAATADTQKTAEPRCLEGWASMRIGIVFTLAWLLLAPTVAWAESPARCEHLNFQVAHFEAQEARAEQLGSDLWADRFGDHLNELKERRRSCPGYSDSDVAMRQMKELMDLAARGAISFFTWGMAPGL